MVCWIVTQVLDVCLTWLVGICGTGPAGLVDMKTGGFVDNVDCMGRWPSYGGSAVAMGEWPAYGDLPKRMGNASGVWLYGEGAKNLWGGGQCRRPLNCMENRGNVWEMSRNIGTCSGIWGGRRAVWGAKITPNPGIWELVRHVDFADFSEFLVGTASVWKAVEMYGDR